MGVSEVAKTRRARGGRGHGKRTPELEEQLLAWIADGKTVRDFCRQDGYPSHVAVYDWLNSCEAFALRFARARKIGFDAIADETMAMSDEPPPTVGGRVDHGHVQWVKNRVWTRLQLLAKWDPKRYGEHILDLSLFYSHRALWAADLAGIYKQAFEDWTQITTNPFLRETKLYGVVQRHTQGTSHGGAK